MYASDEKVRCTLCREVNHFGLLLKESKSCSETNFLIQYNTVLWHCLNHRLELAAENAQEIIRGTLQMIFSYFFNIYIHCTASHQRTNGNSANVFMICK